MRIVVSGDSVGQDQRMVRDTPSPGPRVGPSPGAKKRGPRAKSLRRMGPSLSPFQERLKETDFYTKPLIDKFDTMSSVKVGFIQHSRIEKKRYQNDYLCDHNTRKHVGHSACFLPNICPDLLHDILQDRLLLINESLSEDTTDITRAWPLQLKTKDSR